MFQGLLGHVLRIVSVLLAVVGLGFLAGCASVPPYPDSMPAELDQTLVVLAPVSLPGFQNDQSFINSLIWDQFNRKNVEAWLATANAEELTGMVEYAIKEALGSYAAPMDLDFGGDDDDTAPDAALVLGNAVRKAGPRQGGWAMEAFPLDPPRSILVVGIRRWSFVAGHKGEAAEGEIPWFGRVEVDLRFEAWEALGTKPAWVVETQGLVPLVYGDELEGQDPLSLFSQAFDEALEPLVKSLRRQYGSEVLTP